MKFSIFFILFLVGCSSNQIKEHGLNEILMQHNQGGYFTAKEYLEYLEKKR